MEHTTNIFIGDTELKVTFNYHKGKENHRQGFERFAEPDEPDELEITNIEFLKGNILDLLLTDICNEEQEICNALCEKAVLTGWKNEASKRLSIQERIEEKIFKTWEP